MNTQGSATRANKLRTEVACHGPLRGRLFIDKGQFAAIRLMVLIKIADLIVLAPRRARMVVRE